MTDWATVVVVVAEKELDEVCSMAWHLGVSGIEEQALKGGAVELRIACEGDRAGAVCDALSGRWTPRSQAVAADTGLDAWREHARVWRAGPQVVVMPPWLDEPVDITANDLLLVIDPGHSFGSASHETTRLCVAAVLEVVEPGMSVADIGCGSGVLSIAAARVGASRVTATDTSPAAIIATIDNARRNGVEDLIEASLTSPDVVDVDSYDVVLANIGAITLCSMAKGLATITKLGGRLVLSGVLVEQVDDVVSALALAGVSLDETRTEGEWAALLMHRNGGA